MADEEKILLQIQSLLMYEYLRDFSKFEKIIQSAFSNDLQNIKSNTKQQFYFYHGGSVYTQYDYVNETIRWTTPSYSDEENFSSLRIIQILKISRSKHGVPVFNFEFNSIQSRNKYLFEDAAINIVNMRNEIAHNGVELKFKEKFHYFEILSIDNLSEQKFDLLDGYDIRKIEKDNKSLCIASNLVYMKLLIKELENRI